MFTGSVQIYRTQKSCISRYFHTTLQLQNLPVNCASELFKSSRSGKSSSSQWKQKIFDFGFQFFCVWCHKWSRFLAILDQVTWPKAQPQKGSISLNLYWKLRWNPNPWAFDQLSSVFGLKDIV